MKEKNVLTLNEERTKMQMLDQWLRDLTFPGDPTNFIQEISGQGEPGGSTRSICFYTNNHCYKIIATESTDGNSYLSCFASTRKARAGEDWLRGNDLPDGDFTKETWNRILNAIICYELEKLSSYQKPSEIPEEL